jgi:hypothetical protein
MAVYAAVVSTVVALWNWHTWKRSNRPHLVAFFSASDRRIVGSDGPMILMRAAKTWQGGSLVVHNRGGASTELLSLSMATRARWCPWFLLPLLGKWAFTATSESSVGRPDDGQATVAAGEDGKPLHAMLTEQDLRALDQGLLLLLAKHSWSRERPARIRIYLADPLRPKRP